MLTRFILLMMTIVALSGCSFLTEFTVTSNSTSSDDPIGDVGTVITVTGEVTGSIGDCAFDGICATIITTDDGKTIDVIWAEGMVRCEGQYEDIAQGQRLEARAEVIGASQVSICRDATYYHRPA